MVNRVKDSQWWEKIQTPKTILFFALLLICFIPLISPSNSYSMSAQMTDILVTTNNAHYITVYARVVNCFTKKMESAILAGVPTTFTFLVELYQERDKWFSKKIYATVAKQTIKYDNVKKIFYVSSAGAKLQSSFQDFETAKKAMAELNGVTVFPVKNLQKDKTYYIKIKAKLDKIQLPMHMESVLFFISFWDFETDWYKQKFVHELW
jgi:hypothetical protein